MVITPFLIPSQPELDMRYLHPIRGVLSTDTYALYPYEAKDLEIGFSRYGEFVTPQNMSYTEEGWLTGRGLCYDAHEAFASSDNQNKYYPLEGWFFKYSYLDYSTNTTESDLAYALYSDLDNKIPEGGRTKNLLAEPVKIIYDGARRFVAQTTVHILHHDKNVINLEQTIMFNKVSKYVIVLMDVKFLEPADRVGPLYLNISRRANFKLAHSLITKQSQSDDVYAQFWRSIPTVYKYPGWAGHNETGYYTLIAVHTTSQMTAGSAYTGFAAYWPNVTDSRVYGWDEWNQTIDNHQTPSTEPRQVLLIGEWDSFVLPESSKRFVVVYGIVDGASPEENQELQLQLDMVFSPWGLRDAIKPDITYRWILVGRDSTATVFDGAALLRQRFSVGSLGFDMRNSASPEDPYLFYLSKDAGENPADYRDYVGRLHFKEKWNENQIVGSNLIVLGRPSANLGSEYFNDCTSAFLTEKGIYVPSRWNKTLYSSGLMGYAVITASRDLNNTAALIIWGVTLQDTYYASFTLASGLLEELQAIPLGITTIILKFNYSFSPSQDGFSTIIERLGTITEFDVHL